MKLTTVECRLSRTVSRNFNSTQVQAGLTAELEPGDDPEAVYRLLRDQARRQIAEAFATLAPAPAAAQNGNGNGVAPH